MRSLAEDLLGVEPADPFSIAASCFFAEAEKREAQRGKAPLWVPNPGPQTEFYQCEADEALYGGAAGGGKSAALIAIPLQWCNHEGFRGIIFRRETTQFQDLLDKAAALYPKQFPGARWRGDEHTWTFPSGAVIRFAHCKDADDHEKYHGHEYHYEGFDELTHFLQLQFRELTKRVRSPIKELPKIVRATTNPGSAGHEWVFARWGPWLNPECALEDWEDDIPSPDGKGTYRARGTGLPARYDATGTMLPPAEPGRVLWFVQTVGGERLSSTPVEGAQTRTFIPARLADNPKLIEGDPLYYQKLLDNDPVRVEQLANGNWLVKPSAGLYFKRHWAEIVDSAPADCLWVRAWDKAATEPTKENPDPDWTRGVKMGWSPSMQRYYIADLVSLRGGPGAVKATIKATADLDGQRVRVRVPQDPGQAGKSQAVDDVVWLSGYAITYKPVSGDKVTRFSPFSSQASPQSTGGERGRVCLVRGAWNETLIKELEEFPDGAHDDIVDAVSDAFDELRNYPRSVPLNRSRSLPTA